MYSQEDIISMISQYDAGQQVTPPETEAPTTDAPAADVPTPEAEAPQPIAPDVAGQGDKDANAFAEMRVQNKLFADTLQKIADATGIQYTNQDEMIAALNGDALNKIAEKKGIPVELLQRMEMLEANSRKWEEQQTQQRLAAGFTGLQSEFGLDQQGLMAFAQQLDADKVDLSRVDLRKEYIARNFESIMNARIQSAVQEALTRDAQVGAQSTAPVAPGAQGGGGETKIKTAADLVSFLNANAIGGYK